MKKLIKENGKWTLSEGAKYKIGSKDGFSDEYSFEDFVEDFIEDSSIAIDDIRKTNRGKKVTPEDVVTWAVDYYGEDVIFTKKQYDKVIKIIKKQL